MPSPWELPHYARPHHAIPCGDGIWRGPLPQGKECLSQLNRLGLFVACEFADGSFGWKPQANWKRDIGDGLPVLANGEINDPHWRALWIATRIAVGMQNFANFPDQPPGFMAIMNLTPDSFSDGGNFIFQGELNQPHLLEEAQRHQKEGAEWLDLGAESTRPGAEPISAKVQLAQLLPAIACLKPLGVKLSVDTRSPKVAEACLAEGARMINDVSALGEDGMAEVCAAAHCQVALMHMRGTPATMQQLTQYRFALGEVADEMVARAAYAVANGIQAQRIHLDPGIGFAKDAATSLSLLGELAAFRALGLPILVGPSRKSFMNKLLPNTLPADLDFGSAGMAALAAACGVSMLRLHSGKHQDAWVTAWAAGQAHGLARLERQTC